MQEVIAILACPFVECAGMPLDAVATYQIKFRRHDRRQVGLDDDQSLPPVRSSCSSTRGLTYKRPGIL